jgi:hypothetical protein
MNAIVGPVLARPGGFAFDIWQPASGRTPSFTYRRLDDAYYARNYELTQLQGVACDTLAAFVAELVEQGLPPVADEDSCPTIPLCNRSPDDPTTAITKQAPSIATAPCRRQKTRRIQMGSGSVFDSRKPTSRTSLPGRQEKEALPC